MAYFPGRSVASVGNHIEHFGLTSRWRFDAQKTSASQLNRSVYKNNRQPFFVFRLQLCYNFIILQQPNLNEANIMKQFKIVVEKHPDTYVAYPLGLKGVVVGQGDTYEAALADVKSAIKFHIETFGPEQIDVDPPILEAFIAEAGVAV
jgi:predicted RNase H-like HicB family nuclease